MHTGQKNECKYLLFQLKPDKWLLVPRHMFDRSKSTCRNLGASTKAFLGQEGRCFQMKNSYVYNYKNTCYKCTCMYVTMWIYVHTCMYMHRCFDRWTPSWVYEHSHMMYTRKGRKSPYHPSFYGKVTGFSRVGVKNERNLQFEVPNDFNHQSLITLTFVADSVSFLSNR